MTTDVVSLQSYKVREIRKIIEQLETALEVSQKNQLGHTHDAISAALAEAREALGRLERNPSTST